MVSGGSIRRLLGGLGMVACVLLSAGSVLAAPQDCEVQVSPRAAPAGSVFVFSGSGYKPTELTLQKGDGAVASHELSLGDDDAWEFTLRSRIGDEGTWTANFIDPDHGCTATISIRVTLSNTDLVDDIAAVTSAAPTPWLLYLAVVVLGFTGGLLMGHLRRWVRA